MESIRPRLPGVALAAMLSLLTACTHRALTCATGQQAAVSETLYFGAETPDSAVTAAQWTDFLRDIVTPRFPAGLTSWEASGQWRSADGSVTREPSRVLSLVHAGDMESEASVRAIIDQYKTRHRQEAVLRVKAPVCMSL
jgi:hypothetical protein